MMSYVQSLHDAPDFSYSKGLLCAMHWMLQGHRHTVRKSAGQWRPGAVYVTDARDASIAAYTAPDVEQVPRLMAELVDWLGADEPGTHLLVRAAMAHLNLVAIHPWADGNGRMSRSLQTLMIAREGVLAPEFSSIEAWLGRPGNTWEYYREAPHACRRWPTVSRAAQSTESVPEKPPLRHECMALASTVATSSADLRTCVSWKPGPRVRRRAGRAARSVIIGRAPA